MDTEESPSGKNTAPRRMPPAAPSLGGAYKPPQSIDELEAIAAEPVEFVRETMSQGAYRRSVALRRTLLIIGILVVGIVIAAAGAYAYFIPRMLSGLPSSTNPPGSVFPAYKRVVQGMVDYFPAASGELSKNRIAEVAYGGSIAVVSSADIVPGAGSEGVVRMDLNNPQPLRGAADLELRYRLITATSSPDYSAYFLFNRWPEEFASAVPTSTATDVWFRFDSDVHAQPLAGMSTGIPHTILLTSTTTQARWMEGLWRHALASGALSWKISSLVRRSAQGFVTEIGITLNEPRVPELLRRIEGDKAFMKEFGRIMRQKLNKVSLFDLIASLRSLRGTVAIGVYDRVLYDTRWQYDVVSPTIGSMRGFVSTTVTKLRDRPTLTIPKESLDIARVISAVFGALLSSQAEPAPSAPDRDHDRLSDEEEIVFGTDADNPDTDGDGYIDGDEVTSGYDPRGPGKLE